MGQAGLEKKQDRVVFLSRDGGSSACLHLSPRSRTVQAERQQTARPRLRRTWDVGTGAGEAPAQSVKSDEVLLVTPWVIFPEAKLGGRGGEREPFAINLGTNGQAR